MKAMSAKVSDILSTKAPGVSTIKPSDTIAMLSQRLKEEQVGALIVSVDGRSVDGIISERDIAYSLCKYLGDLPAMPVSALMTKPVITCSPDDDVSDAASVLRERRIRHLPVTENGELVGVIAMRDILMQRLNTIRRITKRATHLVNTTA